MGSARVGSNPADDAPFCQNLYNGAPLVEWSNTLRSGRSPHLRAQVRILQGARFALSASRYASMAQLAERSAVNR